MQTSRILIVEDEFLIRMTLSEALMDEGYEVIEAASASEGLDRLTEDRSIGLMMTDIQLPGGMDGVELGRRARALMPDLPIIYVSGRPDALNGTGRTDRDLFIAKPYLPSDITAAVKRLAGPGTGPGR